MQEQVQEVNGGDSVTIQVEGGALQEHGEWEALNLGYTLMTRVTGLIDVYMRKWDLGSEQLGR